jgi:hypothetical protein
MSDTTDEKAIAINTDEVKKVISTLIDNFVKEEAGNRVTRNNMLALSLYIGQAVDGQITLTKQE